MATSIFFIVIIASNTVSQRRHLGQRVGQDSRLDRPERGIARASANAIPVIVVVRFLQHGSNGLLVAGIAALAIAWATGYVVLAPLFIAAGAVLFFVSEYGTHRFLLHAAPAAFPFVLALQRRLHYDHHLEPERLDLLFLPPWFLIPALALFAAAYWAISRSATVTAALVFGNVLGLLYYEWVHYVAHVPFRPRTRYGRWIKKYHLWHHFKSERLWFGVTNPLPDVVARTYRGVEEVERSPSTRVLFR